MKSKYVDKTNAERQRRYINKLKTRAYGPLRCPHCGKAIRRQKDKNSP